MSSVDLFGPNFAQRLANNLGNTTDGCPICFEPLKEFYVFPCNLGHERVELFDRIVSELDKAWKEGRHPDWIDDKWVAMDIKKLEECPFLQGLDLTSLHAEADSKQLINDHGFFNTKGLHGVCQDCRPRVINQPCCICREDVPKITSSTCINEVLQGKAHETKKPLSSGSHLSRPLNDQVNTFFDDVKGMFGSFTRSVVGGDGMDRSEHLQIAMHRLDRIVSVAINGLIHNILFHGAVKVTLIAAQRIGFKGLGSWIQLADAAIEWNLSWTEHVIIWKAFVSSFDYSFKQFSVNLSYTSLSHHVNRLDVLAVLWLAFKAIYRADFGWAI